MNKIHNNKIIFSLSITTILAFGVAIIPAETNARINTQYEYGGYISSIPAEPIINQDYSPAPVNYTAPTTYSNNSNQKNTNTVNKTNDSTTPTFSETENTNTSDTANTSSNTDNGSNLASNAIFGSGSFLPSGLIQWILLAIIILVIVILVRKISGAEDKYHSEPLKHA